MLFSELVTDTGFVALGVGLALGTQWLASVIRRVRGSLSAAERQEALAQAAERRAKEADEKRQLAENELARLGAVIPKPERVKIRPM